MVGIRAVELRGPTLTLRLPAPTDARALLRLAADEEVTRFFSWGPYTSLEQPEAYLARQPGRRERGEQLDLLIVHRRDGPVGVTGLSELSVRDRRAIVGTWLGRAWWGTGVNLEAKALIAALAFGHCGLERLGAYADVHHARSQAALARIGFRREGVLRAWHRHGDQAKDVVMHSLLREEWRRTPALHDVATTLTGEVPAAFVVA